MTKRADRKLPPRLGPLYGSVQQLEQFRAHPAYAEGAFIDDAAARTGQRRRRAVPRQTQAMVHELVAAQVAATDGPPAYPVLPESPYAQLTETFQRIAVENEQPGAMV